MKFRKFSTLETDTIEANAVVMNTASMKCYLLNDMAATLWDALDHFQDRSELVALLAEAGVQDADGVVNKFAADLIASGLIEAVTA